MSLLSSLLTLCSLLIFVCHATDKCLSFSGGGIRAAIGAYFTMRRIEMDKKLKEIKCVSMISGGSWGFTMWLFEDKPGSVNRNILKWMYSSKGMKEWGPKGPVEMLGDGLSWWEKWEKGIQEHILDKTSLKGKHPPRFEGALRAQLKKKGLDDVTLYYVVESVDTQIYRTKTPSVTVPLVNVKVVDSKKVEMTNRLGGLANFKDYCYFKSAPPDKDVFKCTKEKKNHPIGQARIKQTGPLRRIHIIDVLAYCSSAWATQAGQANKHKQTTKEFRIYSGGKFESWRLVDAGGTFNDPLVPYMVEKRYSSDNNIEIWNFDFSHYSKDDPLGNIREIRFLNRAMKKIGRPLKKVFIDKPFKGKKGFYTFNVKNRVIKHCPLYGKYSKDKLITYFPTMKNIKVWGVKTWHIMRYMFFEADWSKHLRTILKTF